MKPHAPIDEWMEIKFRLKMSKDRKTICPTVRVHNDKVHLDTYKHETKGFDEDFQHVDAMCLSIINMWPYCDVRLKSE